jgi:tRNA(Ile2) C34 agmatinyltransferase TiaS
MELIPLLSHLLLIFGCMGPTITLITMALLIKARRCPLCGARMAVEPKGGWATYMCERCKHWETEVLK